MIEKATVSVAERFKYYSYNYDLLEHDKQVCTKKAKNLIYASIDEYKQLIWPVFFFTQIF